LRYAYKYELISRDLALVVPTVSLRSCVTVVYSPVEIEKLLTAVNRESSLGKRNYAIVLIAARLGLRASGIAGMTLDCVNATSKTIKIK